MYSLAIFDHFQTWTISFNIHIDILCVSNFFRSCWFFRFEHFSKSCSKKAISCKNGFSSFRSSDPFRENEVKYFDLIDFRWIDFYLRISFEKSKGRDFQSRRFFSSDGRFMRECSISFLDGRNRLPNRRINDRWRHHIWLIAEL